jgi:hypothetical protein
MPGSVATSIIVFGRGLYVNEAGLCLTNASVERVKALMDYIEENRSVFDVHRATVVFSGGWGALSKIRMPPVQFREGALMFKYAQLLPAGGKDFSEFVNSYIEIESDSTLENVLRTKEAGYFRNVSFSAANPLGVVAHAGHQQRVDYFVRKVFGLPREAVLHINAHGSDHRSGLLPEEVVFLLTRLAFIGATSHSSLRRRQRLMLIAHSPLRARSVQRPH